MNDLDPKKNNYQINWTLFDKILTNNDYTKMDMLSVVKDIYSKTYMYFSLGYQEAIQEQEFLTKKVLEKNKVIENLQEDIIKLEKLLDENGIERERLSKKDLKKSQKD